MGHGHGRDWRGARLNRPPGAVLACWVREKLTGVVLRLCGGLVARKRPPGQRALPLDHQELVQLQKSKPCLFEEYLNRLERGMANAVPLAVDSRKPENCQKDDSLARN